MATSRTPPVTRSQTTLPSAEHADVLRQLLEELRQLREEQRLDREEQQRSRDELEARLVRQEARNFAEEQLALPQLSPSLNYIPLHANAEASRGTGAGAGAVASTSVNASANPSNVNSNTGVNANANFRLKPDTFDGTAPFSEFMTQFSIIACASGWDDATRAMALAACLRGKARSVLDAAESEGGFGFAELKERLELRFGERESAHNYYVQFSNRKQASGEDFATLGADLERLCRRAYPECAVDVRERIACSQFVSALTDGFVKRTLQLEGVTALRAAIERAKAIRIIHENSFSGRRDGGNGGTSSEQGDAKGERRRDPGNKRGDAKGNGARAPAKKECWQCGAEGHFRAECPTLKAGGN